MLDLEVLAFVEGAAAEHDAAAEDRHEERQHDSAEKGDEAKHDKDHQRDYGDGDPYARRLHEQAPALRDPAPASARGRGASAGREVIWQYDGFVRDRCLGRRVWIRCAHGVPPRAHYSRRRGWP